MLLAFGAGLHRGTVTEMAAGAQHVQQDAQTSLQTAVTTWCGRTEGRAQRHTRKRPIVLWLLPAHLLPAQHGRADLPGAAL